MVLIMIVMNQNFMLCIDSDLVVVEMMAGVASF